MTGLGFVLALACAPAVRAGDEAGVKPPEAKASAATRIVVSFKLDPRLTRGLHMGERWVTRARYARNSPSATAAIEARGFGMDAIGDNFPIAPRWSSSDPAMLSVEPGEGHEVVLTVSRVGASALEVAHAGITARLQVTASAAGEGLDVEIVQEAAPASPGTLATQRERMSYATGVDFGVRLKRQGVLLDEQLVARGLQDALDGATPLLSPVEIKRALAELSGQLAAERTRAANRRRETNERSGREFLAENAGRAGVTSLPSGVQYKVLQAGGGRTPTASDTVVCHYRGTLVDGTEFDDSRKRGKPATLALGKVIQGWQQALPLMPAGSKWQIVVPPDLGYGSRGTRGIPPGSTLVFEVELLEVREAGQAASATPASP
jgi:FKBP-type peptidyl-prolyl cis-trans isomerase FklB